ncbi:nucleolar protein [Yamadazyma tenuis]|uniref:RNA-binding domain-containing protein n=1 Tax=Candida tenuis (strain ATCC 10573 / BCRC 21748 / CBS 615 / JCM 9827 / NBRC 10315 / NRRL Y-1498 / VKM Y-70) TaxID=590646 RepID=G3B956_CANTC|nr:RNA-binding domain-containing protein [Yamadazyma tenuis ATCC 10573]EGV62469.1 RNA-binding domain-containing protein [Yamadazyma tenuis ATCC 10573]WEJ93754.1 nucleolar protein [Yamadazyma tenuis]
MAQKAGSKYQVKPVKRTEIEELSANKDEIEVASSSSSESDINAESDVELSEDSESDSEDEQDQIKGLEDNRKHVIIKPARIIDTSKSKGKKGVIYLGRIPDGFYEAEMEKYFKQFGEITRVKLSRNKKTGKSKHYGFIEFTSVQVAKVASEAMNNYLLYGHLIKCYVVDNPSDLMFSQSKFKIIPWRSVSKHRNDKPKSQQHWDKLSKKFESNQQKRKSGLQQKGIDLGYLD